MSCFKSFESSKALKYFSKTSVLCKGRKFFHVSANRFAKDLRNHYEVLQIEKNSTAKEIRDAFLKLSKESHPDKNQSDPNNHEKFVRINEAYSVLSQPGLRADYDLGLSSKLSDRRPYVHVHRRPGFSGRREEDYIIYETLRRARENADKHEHYYGVPGIEKKSNGQIFIFLLVLSIFGGFLQYFLVRTANINIQANFQQRTEEYNELLRELNMQAQKRGNKYVINQFHGPNEEDPNKANSVNSSDYEKEDSKTQ